MKPLLVSVVVGLFALSATVLAAPTPERIRGTVEAVGDGSMTVRTIDGVSATIVRRQMIWDGSWRSGAEALVHPG